MLRPLRVYQPTSVTEASAELARLGEDAKVYAGGTELILLLRLGLVQYTHLVDVKKVPELGELAWDGKTMHISAAVTHRRLERSAEVAAHLPLLQQAAELVANVRVRNVGTIGGNLCFGDPHSDPVPALLVHDTRVKIGTHSGDRTIGLEAFFVGLYETAIAPDEILVELQVEPLPPGVGSAYLRAARFERPSLGVAVAAAQHDGRLANVRLAVSCVGPVPMRLQELESRIAGATLAEAQQIVRQAQRHYEEVLQPVDDLHGSAAYKTYLTGVLLGRALAQAVAPMGATEMAEALHTGHTRPVSLQLNGQPWQGEVRAEETLLECVRERLRLTGTKRSCESQVCGACTVLVDGEPISSCTYLAFAASGKCVTTIEGLAPGGRLDPLQEAFIQRGAAQCGFCTSGMLLACKALLQAYPQPTREQIGRYLNGNICRCGAYVQILEAIQDVVGAKYSVVSG